MTIPTAASSEYVPTECVAPVPQDWQAAFLELLPRLDRSLRLTFRGLMPEEREEATQEALCSACRAFARLASEGRMQVASAESLARYAAAGYRRGRRFGTPLNINDVCSEYCRRRRGVTLERLAYASHGAWQEALVEDRTVTPAELAASRIDFQSFLESLAPQKRQIAAVLATGESTGSAARIFGVTAGRISQLRRDLYAVWSRFDGAEDPAPASALA